MNVVPLLHLACCGLGMNSIPENSTLVIKTCMLSFASYHECTALGSQTSHPLRGAAAAQAEWRLSAERLIQHIIPILLSVQVTRQTAIYHKRHLLSAGVRPLVAGTWGKLKLEVVLIHSLQPLA